MNNQISNHKSINNQSIILVIRCISCRFLEIKFDDLFVVFLGFGDRNLMMFSCFWRPGMPEHPQGLLLDGISCFMMIWGGCRVSFGELFWLLLEAGGIICQSVFLDVFCVRLL